jgi:hypothetical protein
MRIDFVSPKEADPPLSGKSTQRNTRTFTTLAVLILLMFFFWTLETITSWYAVWYIFIKYGDTSEDEFLHLGSSMSESTTAFVNVMNLWTTSRMVIGDSIIVRSLISSKHGAHHNIC